jgi:hypothetical protein
MESEPAAVVTDQSRDESADTATKGVAVLSIQQIEQYLGNGRWRWSVWLEGVPEELDSNELLSLDFEVAHVYHTREDHISRGRSDRF